jgi:hypothetical protein
MLQCPLVWFERHQDKQIPGITKVALAATTELYVDSNVHMYICAKPKKLQFIHGAASSIYM